MNTDQFDAAVLEVINQSEALNLDSYELRKNLMSLAIQHIQWRDSMGDRTPEQKLLSDYFVIDKIFRHLAICYDESTTTSGG